MANAHDLLMAKRAAMMGKSGYTAKDYVQDGLIAMWDGIENAGWGVHDPNATVWKDLVGSLELDINSADDKNVLAVPGKKSLHIGIGDEFTIEYSHFHTFYTFSTYPIRTPVQLNNESGTRVAAVSYEIGNPNILGRYTYGTNSSGYDLNVNIDSTNDFRIGATYDGSVFSGFSYGDLKTQKYPSSGAGSVSTGVFFDVPSATISDTRFRFIRIYNRALSASEIAANYEIDKARFGLT